MPMRPTTITRTLALAALLTGSPVTPLGAPLGAQDAGSVSAYLLLRGADTLAFEQVRRTPLGAAALIAGPGQPRIAIEFTFGADHLVTHARFTVLGVNAAAGAAPLQTGTLELTGDSAFLVLEAGGSRREIRTATPPGTLPVVNNDFVVLEQAVRRARALRVTALDIPLYALSAAQVVPARVELLGGDSVRFTIGGNVSEATVDASGRVTGGRVAAAGIHVAVVTGAAAERIALPAPDYSAPPGAPYTAEEVSVPTPAGHRLAGTLTLPAPRGARVPAVVTITGSGHQDRDEFIPVAGGYRLFRQVADTLSRRGIAVLRLDDRGIGGSGGDPLGTTADFADDIRAAVAWLRGRPEVDPARIALVGHSEGGTIAPMVAADDPKLAAIALLAGTGYTGRRIIDFQLENGIRGTPTLTPAQQDSAIAATRASFDSTAARGNWMRFFLSHDPVPTIRRVRQPVLILQGATDQQVRPEEARLLDRALREAGNRRVTLRILPDRNHFFLRDPVGHPRGYADLRDPRVDAEVLGILADWLAQALGAR